MSTNQPAKLTPTSNQPAKPVASIAKSLESIDSVLDIATAQQQPVRPLAKLRPSWIGPRPSERPMTPGVQAMKQHVTIEYSSPGLQPPVYICTSLSDPQWEPIEMHREKKDGGGWIFSKVFNVEEGEYQYKFRLGPGDWWVCDESKPMLDDGSGNKNNVIVVQAQGFPLHPPPAVEQKDLKPAPAAQNQTPSPVLLPVPKLTTQTKQDLPPAHEEISAPLPTVKHEDPVVSKGVAAPQTPQKTETFDTAAENDVDNETTSDDDDSSSSSSSSSDSDDADDGHTPPLLRHESIGPHSAEHAPLFRHESIGSERNHHSVPQNLSPGSHNESPTRPQIDPNDSSLQKLDHADMLDIIRRMSLEKAGHGEGSPLTQLLSGSSSKSAQSLGSLRETEAEEELKQIRRMEEEEMEREEAEGEEVGPLNENPRAPLARHIAPGEPEDEDFEPKVRVSEKVQFEERIVIQILEPPRKSLYDALLASLGGSGNAL